jgi:GNAT superfamily N-acetyltransferase
VYAAAPVPEELTISVGTSSQVSRVAISSASMATVSASSTDAPASIPSAVECRPYICPYAQRSLLLCASLNGGNVLQTFVQGVQRMVQDLNFAASAEEVTEDLRQAQVNAVFARFIREGTAALQHHATMSTPCCDARFFGERTSPAARGSLSNLHVPLLDPFQAGGGSASIFLSLCHGVIANLRRMIDGSKGNSTSAATTPHLMLRDVQSIRCVGAALQRNPLLVHFISEVFGVPAAQVRVTSAQQGDADAAHGAALLALDWAEVNAPLWRTDADSSASAAASASAVTSGLPANNAPLDTPAVASSYLATLSAGSQHVLLRRATEADLPAVVMLLADDSLGSNRESADNDFAPYRQAFRLIDADPSQWLLVVEDGKGSGRIVATCQLSFIPCLSRLGCLRAQIESVRVASAWRSRGLGRALISWVVAESRRRGAGMVQLASDKTREEAIRFYKSIGFVASHEGMKLYL